MFYRRKIILSIIQLAHNEIDKIALQKMLFLFTRPQLVKTYDFIPYKFGCFSYSANADLNTMVKQGLLTETNKIIKKIDSVNYLKTLKPEDLKIINQTQSLYGKLGTNALIKHTYLNFPYWAIKSQIVEDVLNTTELKKVNKEKPASMKTTLYTIGYEGISLEEYLNRLVKNDVKMLVDVRRNPLSMKYGFSKTLLKKYCESLQIEYVHIPEVGIEGSQRQELNNQKDYDKLFDFYIKNNLSKTKDEQNAILMLLKKYKRIALTCFEADICQCHRTHLAESIKSLNGFTYQVKHI